MGRPVALQTHSSAAIYDCAVLNPKKLQLPRTSLVLCLLLAILLLSLPQWNVNTQSQVGRILKGRNDVDSLGSHHRQTSPIVLRKTATGWESSDPSQESWDMATRTIAGKVPDAVVYMYSPPLQIDSGLLALTRRETFETLNIFPEPDAAIAREQRVIVLEHLIKKGHSTEIMARLIDHNVYSYIPLLSGYFFNSVFLILSLLLLWSLAWLLLVPSWIRLAVAKKRLARGVCPRCLYSLRNLQSQTCPECGTPIQPAA